jgi:hypothetical protein
VIENSNFFPKDSSGDLKVNEEEFQNALKDLENVNIPKHRFSKDLDGLIKGNLQMTKVFGSMINKEDIPSQKNLIDSSKNEKMKKENSKSGELNSEKDKRGSEKLLSNMIKTESKKKMEGGGKNSISKVEDSYIGDKESTILNSMIVEKGEQTDNFFKRGTLVMPAPTAQYNQMVLRSLEIKDRIQEEKDEFSIQTGGFPSDKKKKSSNFEEKFKLQFEENNPFLQKEEDIVRKRVQSEFVMKNEGNEVRERVKSEKKVRFDNDNIAVQIGSNIQNQEDSIKEEEMFNQNMNMVKKNKTKKGKTFVETMTNIYNDLDQTLNEVENVNNDTSLDEGKKFKFEYQGLEVGQMMGKPLTFDSTESEEEKQKEDPQELLKKSDIIGIDLQDYVKKKPEEGKEEEIKEENKEENKEGNQKTTQKEESTQQEEIMKENNPQYSNLLSKYIRVSPKIYQSSRRGDKYIINVEENVSQYTSVNIKTITENSVDPKMNYFSTKNSFQPKQFVVQSGRPSPKNKKKVNSKGLLSLRVSPKRRFIETGDNESKRSPMGNYDTPLKYQRFMKDTGSQPQSKREFKFLRKYTSRRTHHQSKPRSPRFSKQSTEMENRLKVLFKKFFVYLSKIETLKMKLYKFNDESLTYYLYREFCHYETNTFDFESLRSLLRHLNLDMEESMMIKLVFYLKKFPREFQKKTTPTQMNGKDLVLCYPEFRELFVSHKIRLSEEYLHSEWESSGDQHESIINKSQYFLLRQILILKAKQLEDISRVVDSLHVYSAEKVFHFIFSFSAKKSLSSIRYNSRSQSPGVSFSNNNQNGNWSQTDPDPADSTRNKMKSSNLTEVTKQQSGVNSENLGSILLRKFLRKSSNRSQLSSVKMNGSPANKSIPSRKFNINPLTSMELETLPEVQTESVLDVATIKMFLTHLGIEYLREDLGLLMNALGTSTGFLPKQQFFKFFYSKVWDY